jgi:hypothetical protein
MPVRVAMPVAKEGLLPEMTEPFEKFNHGTILQRLNQKVPSDSKYKASLKACQEKNKGTLLFF